MPIILQKWRFKQLYENELGVEFRDRKTKRTNARYAFLSRFFPAHTPHPSTLTLGQFLQSFARFC
jgi:hypothetical protein